MHRTIACVCSCDRLDEFVQVRSAGFDAIALELPSSTPPAPAPWNWAEVEKLAREHGLSITALHAQNDTLTEESACQRVRDAISRAGELGAKTVLVNAGDADSLEQRRRVLDRLRELGDLAAANGVTLAIDTQPGLMQTWRGMLASINEINHPSVRIAFDTGNVMYYNPYTEVETSLARTCHLVAHVRLRDAVGFSQRSYGALGRGGGVNFFRVRELLDVCGFRGVYAVVLDQRPGAEPITVEAYAAQLRQSLETLQWSGYYR